MKPIFPKIILIGVLFMASACQEIDVGIEPTATIAGSAPTTPTQAAVQTVVSPPSISAATPTSPIITPTSENLVSYTQSSYGFSFKYPATWEIQQEKNFITLKNGLVTLQMGFKRDDESVQIIFDPQPSTPLVQDRDINFLIQTISRNALITDKDIMAVYYNNGAEIRVGSMLFSFLLSTNQTEGTGGISRDIQDQADQILASFEATFELTTSPCTDKVSFIQDVTVLDDTRFSPGEKFTKTWRLSNAGTCIWTTKYALVFVDGDQMSGQSSQPFASEIIPGQTADFSIDLTAPASAGTYRGNWMLQNDLGERFGLGLDADKPFWVQISVGETAPDIRQTLGEPSFKDTLASTNNWYLLDTPDTKFSAGDNELILTAINTGQNDEWGIANISPLKDFYLEIQFTTTETCTGLDRYGVIVRAPDPNQGYVFGFSCDGRYRLYKWDGNRYQAIQEWKNSPNINSGPDQTNRLGIYLKGNNIKLYANGQFLSEYTDDTFSEGRIGVFIGAAETKGFTVLVDEAAYWKFND